MKLHIIYLSQRRKARKGNDLNYKQSWRLGAKNEQFFSDQTGCPLAGGRARMKLP
jgi:hypothetical protein